MTVTKTSLSSSFTLPVQFVKCGKIFLELNSETVSKFSKKRKNKVVVLRSRPLQIEQLSTFTF